MISLWIRKMIAATVGIMAVGFISGSSVVAGPNATHNSNLLLAILHAIIASIVWPKESK